MHQSRLCALLIDCNTSNTDEAARFAQIQRVDHERLARWIVMQAPTGQRFCVVRVQRPGFPRNANRWD